jgi:hypothetical protein
MGVSTVHHSNYTRTNYLGGPVIAFIDRALAKLIGVYLFVNAVFRFRFTRQMGWAWLFNAGVPLIYYLKLCRDFHRPYEPFVICELSKWHAAMHIVGTIGGILFVREASRQNIQNL